MNAWLTCLSISVYVCAHSSAVNVKVTRHKQIPLHFNVSTFHLGQNVLNAANGKQSALLSGSNSSCLLHGQHSHAALHYSSTSEYHPELTEELFHCAELDLATCAFKVTAPYSIKSWIPVYLLVSQNNTVIPLIKLGGVYLFWAGRTLSFTVEGEITNHFTDLNQFSLYWLKVLYCVQQ